MSASEKLYTEIGSNLKGVEMSQLFGKPALKINGDTHATALDLKKSKLFDPSGTNRPMKEWVQVTFDHKGQWPTLAKDAMASTTKSYK